MLRNVSLKMMAWMQAAKRDESGQGLAEYGLILALIAVVCAGALATFGQAIRDSAGWKLFDAIG